MARPFEVVTTVIRQGDIPDQAVLERAVEDAGGRDLTINDLEDELEVVFRVDAETEDDAFTSGQKIMATVFSGFAHRAVSVTEPEA